MIPEGNPKGADAAERQWPRKRVRRGCVSHGRPVRAGFPYGLAPHRNESVRVVSRTGVPYGLVSCQAWPRTEASPYGLCLARKSRTGWIPVRLGAAQTRIRTGYVSHGRPVRADSRTAWRRGSDSERVVSRMGLIPCTLSSVIFALLASARWPDGLRMAVAGLAIDPRKACNGPSEGQQWAFGRPAISLRKAC